MTCLELSRVTSCYSNKAVHVMIHLTIGGAAQRQSIQTISCRFLSSCCSTVLRAMLFSQECFSLACLMFLLWILYYMKLFFTAVQVRQQQGNIQQQTLSATRQNSIRMKNPKILRSLPVQNTLKNTMNAKVK